MRVSEGRPHAGLVRAPTRLKQEEIANGWSYERARPNELARVHIKEPKY